MGDREGVRTVDDDNFIDDSGADPAGQYESDNELSPSHASQDKRGPKRPRKNQSNRESALESRLCKQAEHNELAPFPIFSPSLFTSGTMSDEDEKTGSINAARPEEEALRLKTLAERKYTSGHLKAALKYAKRAHKLHPSLDGLSEMITAFKILRTAATPVFESSSSTQNSTPDYYKILQVDWFSHINTIKKQYKKLALTLHPDKNPFVASEEAFKLVGEAAQVLSDKIRRKEYDMRLRIAMQSKAAEEVGLAAEGTTETFWTACSACRLLHQFERKYLGHNLMCPRCRRSFKAVEVEDDRSNGGDVGSGEKNEVVNAEQTRVSARIRERAAKGGNVGIVEKCGLGIKRKISSVGDVLKRSGVKVARNMDDSRLNSVEKVEKLGDSDGGHIKGFKLKKVGKLVDVDGRGYPGNKDIVVNELRSRKVEGKMRDGVEDASESAGVEITESERTKRAKAREEETMTLSQMQMLAKKRKLVDVKLMMKEKEVDSEKLKPKDTDGGRDKEKESEEEKEKEKEREEEKEKEKEEEKKREEEKRKEEEEKERAEEEKKEKEEDKEKGLVNLTVKTYRRRVSKDRNLEDAERTSKDPVHSEIEGNGASKKGNLEVVLVGKENENEKENEKEDMREKRQSRRVSKYENLEVVKRKTSKNHVVLEIERVTTSKKDNLEIMPVEDSDFHDFDKDRRGRSFKKGQVWAAYDDDDGMPRQYALIDEIISVNPFEVTLSWLQFQSNGDDDLISLQNTRSYFPCGTFKVSGKVSIKYLNLFSHVVDCERAAREMYKIYPKKGSVWALYSNNESVKDKRNYDIVVSLSSYRDIHGVSIAHLEKVDGFRTVFKRKEIGANAVLCLRKNDIKLISHQIPSKKLSGEEAPGLPRDCWELDPASIPPQLLISS